MTKNTPTRRAGPRRQTASLWKCPQCARTFTQVNQRHACGTGDSGGILCNRPESVVRTYAAIETFVKSLGEIEIVARDRYALFRSVRIFADLNIMSDGVRVAIHLERKVEDPRFIKVVEDRKKVTHVVKLMSESDVDAIKAYLNEAYEVSLR
jgi:hypothetical protein